MIYFNNEFSGEYDRLFVRSVYQAGRVSIGAIFFSVPCFVFDV